MHQIAYHEINAAHSNFMGNYLRTTGVGSLPLTGRNIGNYQLHPIESRSFFSQYIQSSTRVVHPIYNSTKSSELSKITELDLSIKQTLDKEIESDDFLRNFFSVPKKIQRVPTPKQIKEEYNDRFKYDLR